MWHTSCWILTSHCPRPLHHPLSLGVSGSPFQASSGDHQRSLQCLSARTALDEDIPGSHQHICSLLQLKNSTVTSIITSTQVLCVSLWLSLSGWDWPGVEDWLLDEELAELEPRDFRGAEAATATNQTSNRLRIGCVIKRPKIKTRTAMSLVIKQ